MNQLIKPPCNKCPYALGLVMFVDNPCPECKANQYRTYETLTRSKMTTTPKKE